MSRHSWTKTELETHMKPSPMDRRFLDLMDRIETDQQHQSETLSALDQRMARIETTLSQLLESQAQPREDPIPSDRITVLRKDIMTLSQQIARSETVNRVLHQTTVDLHNLMAAPPERADGD